jgi:hypothetical protein
VCRTWLTGVDRGVGGGGVLLTLLGVLALSKEVVLGINFVWWTRTERSLGRSRFFEFLGPW